MQAFPTAQMQADQSTPCLLRRAPCRSARASARECCASRRTPDCGTKGISISRNNCGRRSEVQSSLLPDAIPWTDRERLKYRSLVVCVDWIVEPAFRYEGFGVAEIVLGSIGRPVVHSYCGLGGLVSIVDPTDGV